MKDYTYLEELNLEEVARNTQIEISCLKAIVAKDFARLKKFNLKGFSKILAREYAIDLSSFLEEYEEYLSEHEMPKTQAIELTPRMESYATKGSKIWLWLIGLAALVALASYMNAFSFLYDLKEEFSSSSNTTAVNQAKDNMKNLELEAKKESELLGNDLDLNTSKEEFLKEKDLNDSLRPLELPKASLPEVKDTNESTQVKPKEKKQELKPVKEEEKKPVVKDNGTKIISFEVKDKFWIGTIDLKTHLKKSQVISGDFNLSLNKPTLITTGHAPFKTIFDGEVVFHKGGFTKFFIYKDGEFKKLSRKEFLAKNRGRLW